MYIQPNHLSTYQDHQIPIQDLLLSVTPLLAKVEGDISVLDHMSTR
jgi:hypothetical protein